MFVLQLPQKSCIANQSLLDMAKKRDEKEELRVELASKTQSRSMRATSALGMGEMHSFSSSTHTTTSTMPLTSSLFFVPRSTPWGQSSILSLIKSKKEEAEKLVEKCFIWGDIPFNIAKNNPFYHSMFEVDAIVGLGYKGPSYNDLKGKLFQGEKTDCTRRLDKLRESWEITICSVMSDGWTKWEGQIHSKFLG